MTEVGIKFEDGRIIVAGRCGLCGLWKQVPIEAKFPGGRGLIRLATKKHGDTAKFCVPGYYRACDDFVNCPHPRAKGTTNEF